MRMARMDITTIIKQLWRGSPKLAFLPTLLKYPPHKNAVTR